LSLLIARYFSGDLGVLQQQINVYNCSTRVASQLTLKIRLFLPDSPITMLNFICEKGYILFIYIEAVAVVFVRWTQVAWREHLCS
jgi:hypothetical protein